MGKKLPPKCDQPSTNIYTPTSSSKLQRSWKL